MTALRETFRSLRVRNYRLFFAGQLVSLTGTWMQQIAQDWLVIHLGGRGTAVGLTVGLQFLPMLLFGMAGGALADRADKRRILLATQTAAGVLAVSMGALVATGAVRLWMVYCLAFLLGCVTAVDHPTRQAFVTELVGPDAVTNAVGLNSAVFNSARIVGPAVAALVIRAAGLAPAFFANGASYLAVLAALRAMDPAELHRLPAPRHEPGSVRAGLRYVWSTPELRGTIALVGAVATFGMNMSVTLPLLARFAFAGDAGTYGLLTSVMAAGSLAGALVAARRTAASPRARALTAAAFGASLLATAAAPNVATAAAALVPTGATVILFVTMSNSTLQLRSDPRMRGRVMALYSLVFLGSTPIGGPLTGWISQQLGPRWGLAANGVTALAAAAVALVAGARRPAPRVADRRPGPAPALAAGPLGGGPQPP